MREFRLLHTVITVSETMIMSSSQPAHSVWDQTGANMRNSQVLVSVIYKLAFCIMVIAGMSSASISRLMVLWRTPEYCTTCTVPQEALGVLGDKKKK